MKNFQFAYHTSTVAAADPEVQQLVQHAAHAAATAYAPYSQFKVGAAVLLDDGTIIKGANLENASYPAGICAERAALSSLNINDGRKVVAIAINYISPGDSTAPLSPCGICRQFILEVQMNQQQPIAVYMCGPAEQLIMVDDASLLLPFHFSSQFLP